MRFLLAVCLLGLAASAKVRYDGYKVLQLHPTTDAQIDIVRGMHENVELDFWSEAEVMVPPQLLDATEAMLQEADITYFTINDNVQNDLDDLELRLAQQSRTPRSYNLNKWNTYEQIVEAINTFARDCPSDVKCEIISMGKSYEGRDVPALTITSGDKKVVYLDSLIHSREWLSGATLLRLADRLVHGKDAEAQRMRSTYNWHIAPVINPDGYVYAWTHNSFWRKNRQPNPGSRCVGTDLNRNFDSKWRWSGTSTNPCSQTYGGFGAAASIETQNVQEQLKKYGSKLHAMVAYHAFAKLWLHPHGFTTLPNGRLCVKSPYHDKISAVARAATEAVMNTGGQFWKYGPVCSTIYPASGASVDFSHDLGCIYAFTPEMRGDGFQPHEAEIGPSYREQWSGLVAMVDAIEVQEA